ncbi:MAG: CopG family transcriptional regulator [Mycobacteriales bacterium]|jgi:hypothetical protein
MRTTLSVDDDVLLAVKERARREGRTAGDVLSDLARRALTGRYGDESEEPTFFGFQPFSHRGNAVSNALVDRLREDDSV